MTATAKLVGVARALPEVCTFVTPVFVLDNTPVVQHVVDTRVRGFERTATGEEFTPLRRNWSVSVGDDAVYGFELAANRYLLGTAVEVAGGLVSHFKDERLSTTREDSSGRCVGRFIDEVLSSPRAHVHQGEAGRSSDDKLGESFSNREYHSLSQFLLRHIPAQEVDDVIQEAYRRLLETNSTVLVRNPVAYVHAIAWNVVCDFWRRRRTRTVTFDSDLMEKRMPTLGSEADSIADQVTMEKELWQLLAQLSPTQRKVLYLARVEGCSNTEIAERIGLSVHTVKKYATKAMRRIRQASKSRSDATE